METGYIMETDALGILAWARIDYSGMTLKMKAVAFFAVLSLMFALDGLAGKIPFTPVFRAEQVVRVPVGDAVMVSNAVQLPALPQKEGMTAVLRLNIRQLTKETDGWNPWCALELNGQRLGPQTARHTPRLLGRGNYMNTTYKGEERVAYWSGQSSAFFLTLFTPDETENLDSRILDREDGYNYYFDVDDIVSKVIIGADDRIENNAPNRLRFMNILTRRILNSTLVVKDIELGYVPSARLNALTGIEFTRYEGVARPAAAVKAAGWRLDFSPHGGMELKVGGESIFIESAFSYAASPEMKYNALGIGKTGNQPGVKTAVAQLPDGAVRVSMAAPNLSVQRLCAVVSNHVKVTDTIVSNLAEDQGIKWKNVFAFSGKMPETWRISGLTGALATDSSCMASANPTVYLAGPKGAAGFVVEDTVSRILLAMEASGNRFEMASQGVGLPAGRRLTVEWCIYPLAGEERGYFDFINQVREDWGVNNTVPGPYLIRAQQYPGLNLRFASVAPWFEYADGLMYTREQYVKATSEKVAALRRQFPGIKLMALLETNLVNFDSTTVPWGKELPLTYGDRKNPATAYAQYLSPELSRKLEAVTPLRDSLLRDKDGNIMVDTVYVYQKKPWINLMPQLEKGNARFRQMMEQIDFVMKNVDFDGIYIDQFNPTLKDGVSFDRWDGYSVTLDKQGRIVSKSYNYAITGAEGRMEIVRRVTSKGGVVLTNGHPVTREEQNSGRLSFAEMENDRCNPIPFLDEKPPEFRYQASSHLASPIILNLRPGRYSQEPRMMARVLFKGLVIALRNGVLPYYYTVNIPTSGPDAGGLGVANWMFPFTPVKLGEGVMVGKERTIVCKSGTFTVGGQQRPAVAHFNNMGLEVKGTKAFGITGQPGAWKVKVAIDDWNEIAVMEVR